MKHPWHATVRDAQAAPIPQGRRSAEIVRSKDRVAVGANDLLFVPAGMEHRFEEMSGDFATWVLFHGPVGGERDNPFTRR